MRPLVIGIDGGGTKSHAVLAGEDLSERPARWSGGVSRADPAPLAEAHAGGSNPNVIGFDSAADALVTAIQACCKNAGRSIEDVGAIVMGLAGVGREEDRKTIQSAVVKRLSAGVKAVPRVEVETDARIALEGAFGGEPGIVLIAGTGSIVLGKNAKGKLVRVGGWGRVLGDEGSGYDIGKEAIVAATHDMDGRAKEITVRVLMEKTFGWKSRDDIIEAVYRKNFDIPSVAPLVLNAAANNDRVALRILENAASSLVDQVRALVSQLGVTGIVKAAMLGGLVHQGSIYAGIIKNKLMQELPHVEVVDPMFGPAHGAVIMALKLIDRASR